jgi:hypothetical protein
MKYIVTYKNPNDVTRDKRVEEYPTVAGVNAIKARAKQYPGSCVLISIQKITKKENFTQYFGTS